MRKPVYDRRLTAIILCSAILLSGLLSFFGRAATVHADPACMTSGGVYILFARGSGAAFDSDPAKAFRASITGELSVLGFNNASWAELGSLDGKVNGNNNADDASDYPAVPVSWQNVTGSGYANSVNIGVSELIKNINDRSVRCPNEAIVLGGYSQGADVVGQALSQAYDGITPTSGLTQTAKNHIGFVALYGDPHFNCYGTWTRAISCPPFIQGTFGERDPYIPSSLAGRVGSWCDPGDSVCTAGFGNHYGIGNHGTIYQSTWIPISAQEISLNAILKLNSLGFAPLTSPFHQWAEAQLIQSVSPLPPVISAAPPATNLRPTALQFGSEMDVYQAGGDNAIYKDTWNGSAWGGFSGMDGSTADNPSSVSFNGEMDIFIRGTDGQIYKKTWVNNAWSGWNSLGGSMVGSPTSVAYGSEMDVFARGQDGAVYKDTWNGSFWSGWNSLGGNMTGSPVAVQYGNELDVFSQGSDRALWKDTWNGSNWSGWNTLNGGITGDISAVSYGSHLAVFARGTDNQIWESSWNGTAWTWNCLGGNVPGSPVALSYNGELDVFVRGGDGKIYKQTTWDDTRWSGWTSLDGNMIGDPAAVQYGSEMDVFARASGNGKIYKDTWNGSSWSGWNYLG